MGRKLLLMAYCFPPANIIGAVRPYQIACFFRSQGWEVDVVSIIDESIDDTNMSDVSGISSSRLEAPRFISWLNTNKSHSGIFGRWQTLLLRGLKFILRASVFPEHFIILRKTYVDEALRLARAKKFDLLISSALPFSVHCAAHTVARKLDLPWVADNRDLWAASPYRKTLPLWRIVDRRYERSILSDADLVLGVSQSMVTYYREQYGLSKTLLVMNGYSSTETSEQVSATQPDNRVEIIYGGILYNGVRDPSPLLQAIESDRFLKSRVSVKFFGSELIQVEKLSKKFNGCLIEAKPRVSKADISRIYQGASLLLVVLGSGDFENGVMTGKFFEYLSHGKPVLAIAPEESELANVINSYELGLASRDPVRIASYLRAYCAGETRRQITLPRELSIGYQLSFLLRATEALIVKSTEAARVY